MVLAGEKEPPADGTGNVQAVTARSPAPAVSRDATAGDSGAAIDRLLATAGEDLRANRLTTPAGDNAWENFREVLRMDPDNAAALRGIGTIIERYMALTSERYSHQRACLEYFVGLCDGAGIHMHVPEECDLMKAHALYAFGQESRLVKRLAARKQHVRQQKQQIENQIKQMEQQIMQARMALAGYSGVEDDLDWVAGNWTNGLESVEYVNGGP